jgi:hypothetical protein
VWDKKNEAGSRVWYYISKSPLEKQTRNGAVHTQSIKIEKKNISTVLIRRGGAPSGAAALSFLGVWGSQPPSVIHEVASFQEKSCDINYNALGGSTPAIMASPGCDSVVFPVHKPAENFSTGNTETS